MYLSSVDYLNFWVCNSRNTREYQTGLIQSNLCYTKFKLFAVMHTLHLQFRYLPFVAASGNSQAFLN